MVKFQFSYLEAGTVNHKILYFNETHKEHSIPDYKPIWAPFVLVYEWAKHFNLSRPQLGMVT